MNFQRKIIEINNSLMVTIPADLVRYYELKKGTEIIISDDEDKITIRKKE